jgi:hypothetical protein
MVALFGVWKIEYFDEYQEVFYSLPADFKQIVDDLTGESNASFTLPNTEDYRSLLRRSPLVAVYFNEYLEYSGILCVAYLSSAKLECVLLDSAVLMLDEAEPVTGVYDQVPANEILTEVLAVAPGTNLAIGDCTIAPVTAVFYKANRLDVVKFLAEATGSEFWPTEGTTINIGVRGGNEWVPAPVFIQSRGFDNSKGADKVIIRGVDQFGRHITGEAGDSGWLGARVRVFNEVNPADQTVLENMAAKKLSELTNGSTGSPISTLITSGYRYGVGDYVIINRPEFLLFGAYNRIVQITKSKTRVSFQLDKPRQTVETSISDLRKWEKNGIYLPGCTSWSINLQGLVGHYHLTEGSGTVAKDSSPVENPTNGTIVNGHWDDSPIGGGAKVMALQGDGYVDCTAAISLSVNDSCFSVGGWFSPVDLDTTERHLAHKADQFSLSYVNTVLRFSFTDSELTVHTFNSEAGKLKAYGRIFVMITYDKTTLKMYFGGQLYKSWSLSAALNPSTNKVYIGMFLKGNEAEMMFWTRCLVDQEVAELNFFPLSRSV